MTTLFWYHLPHVIYITNKDLFRYLCFFGGHLSNLYFFRSYLFNMCLIKGFLFHLCLSKGYLGLISHFVVFLRVPSFQVFSSFRNYIPWVDKSIMLQVYLRFIFCYNSCLSYQNINLSHFKYVLDLFVGILVNYPSKISNNICLYHNKKENFVRNFRLFF